jgi:hypothetical protein
MIMQVLQENDRMETVYVASKVGRKPSATAERIERLWIWVISLVLRRS